MNAMNEDLGISLSYFDSLFVINLPSRSDRRCEIARQLKLLNLDLYKPPVRLFSAIQPDNAGAFPSVGARGCFESHLAILRLAKQKQMRRFLILEDDVDFVLDVSERLPQVIAALKADTWDIFYGGYEVLDHCMIDSPIITEIPASVRIRTTHFIGFNCTVLPALIHYLESMLGRPAGHSNGGPMHVDGAYSWFRNDYSEYRTLVSSRELGYQRCSRSDIAMPKWYDKSFILRHFVQYLRRVRARTKNEKR